MKQWEQLLELEHSRWSNASAHDYLGLGEEFNHACPPLLIVGGADVAPEARPLVVISLEPLTGRHYERQAAFAASSPGNHRKWNLDYFNVFPTDTIAGPKPQPYWRTMHDVVAGFTGSPPHFSWSTFARSYIELPSIPVHAKGHPNVSMTRFLDPLRARIDLVHRTWPNATFFALGTATLKALGINRDEGTAAFLFPVEDAERRKRYGDIWRSPVLRYSFTLGARAVPLYWRYAFTRMYRPRAEGRRLIGQTLRDLAP